MAGFASRLLNVLAAIEGVEVSILKAKIPLVSTGVGGTILTIALVAEEDLSAILASLSPSPVGPVPTVPAAPVPAAA